MKKKDLAEMRTKSEAEIEKVISEKKDELEKISGEIKIAREKNLKKAKNIRREISQLLTIQKEKEFMNENKRKEESR